MELSMSENPKSISCVVGTVKHAGGAAAKKDLFLLIS